MFPIPRNPSTRASHGRCSRVRTEHPIHASPRRFGLWDGGFGPDSGGGCRRSWGCGRWHLRGDLGPGEAVGTDALCIEDAALTCRAHLTLAAEGKNTGRHAVSRALAGAVGVHAGVCGVACVRACGRAGVASVKVPWISSGDRKRGIPFSNELTSSAVFSRACVAACERRRAQARLVAEVCW